MADTKTKKTYHLGTGRRKTSVARVRLCEGSGKIVINGRGLEEYFTEDKDRKAVVGPLEAHRDARPARPDRPGARRRHHRPGRRRLPGRRPRTEAACSAWAAANRKAPTEPTRAAAWPRNCADSALPDPRRPHEGTQEVRPQGHKSFPVLQALTESRLRGGGEGAVCSPPRWGVRPWLFWPLFHATS